MKIRTAVTSVSLAALLSCGQIASHAYADSDAQFYEGKTVRLVVSAGAGGMYGRYSTIFAKHVTKHIPGNPTIILDFKPGAGGLEAANYLYNVAPKDGTVIAMLRKDVAQAQVLRPNGIRFDAAKFQWIGGMNGAAVGVISVWHTARATSIESAKAKQVVLGATGTAGEDYTHPMLMNTLVGTKFKIITGYRGIADIDKAIEAGEVHGRGGSWLGFKALRQHWIKAGQIVHLAQIGVRKSPDLPDVPLLTELAATVEEKAVAEFISTSSLTGRTICAPPETVSARVDILRKAMNATMRDPEFLADAKKNKADINPISGEEVTQAMRNMTSASPALVARTKAAMGFK